MISLLIATSTHFCSHSVPSRSVPSAIPTAVTIGDGLDYGGAGAAGTVDVELPYFPDSCKQHFQHSSLVSSIDRSTVASVYKSDANRDETKVWGSHASLPKFTAVVDSGCSAHSTEDFNRLVNSRPCFEVFGASNGRLARATAIGDLPILAKSSSGALVRFTIKDVRYIPDFCYTLLSVRQLWDQHRINAKFADERFLELPQNHTIPFRSTDAKTKLYLLDVRSPASAKANNRGNRATAAISRCFEHPNALASLGFHDVSSISHVGKLSASQAGELIHRRSHLPLAKVRNLPNVTADMPKNLAAAQQCSCAACAAAHAKRAKHSWSLPSSCTIKTLP